MNRRSFIAALGALPLVGRFMTPKPPIRITVTGGTQGEWGGVQIGRGNDYWQGSFLRSTADSVEVYYAVRSYGTFQKARRELWDTIHAQEKAGYKVSRVCLAPTPGNWSRNEKCEKWRWGSEDRA